LPSLGGTPASIAIGPQSVKVARIIEGRRGVRAILCAEQDLPRGFRWEIGGDRGPVVEAIREAFAQGGIRSRKVVMSLPRGQVTARISAFPQASREDMRRVVEYDLADHIPFPLDQVVVDFQQLGPSREQPGLIDVLVVAAPRELVREYLRVAEDLRLTVAALTVDALALDDLSKMAGREPPGLGITLEIGPRATTINVSEADRLRLTRSVAIGGNQLARAIQDDLGVDPREAEQVKQTDGLRLLSRRPQPSAVRAWLNNLTGEIRRSALSFGPAVLSRLLLVGEAAAVPGIAESVQSEFGAESTALSVGDVFPGSELLGVDLQTADRCLTTVAAAARAAGRSSWTISLLPPEVLRRRREGRLRRLSALGVAAVLAAMIALYGASARGVNRLQADVARLRTKGEVAAVQQAKAEEILAERARLEDQDKSLELVRVRRYAALELLRTIGLYAPKEIVLTHFGLRPDQPLQMRGTAPNSTVVADLQHQLGLSPLVTQASLTGVDRVSVRGNTTDQLRFTMELRLWTEREAAPRAASLRPWGGDR